MSVKAGELIAKAIKEVNISFQKASKEAGQFSQEDHNRILSEVAVGLKNEMIGGEGTEISIAAFNVFLLSLIEYCYLEERAFNDFEKTPPGMLHARVMSAMYLFNKIIEHIPKRIYPEE